jgi:hypothetical protein
VGVQPRESRLGVTLMASRLRRVDRDKRITPPIFFPFLFEKNKNKSPLDLDLHTEGPILLFFNKN